MATDGVLDTVVLVASIPVAAVLTVLLAGLDFDTRDTRYWKRWLGVANYRVRRVSLALLPASLGVGVFFALEPTTKIQHPLLRALVASVMSWALLRADAGSGGLKAQGLSVGNRGTSPLPTDSGRQIASASTLAYGLVQKRLDKRTDQRVEEALARQRDQALTDPSELLMTAQELASYFDHAGKRSTIKKKDAAHAASLANSLYEAMDVLGDTMANNDQRTKAAFALYELIAEQFKALKWSRAAVRISGQTSDETE